MKIQNVSLSLIFFICFLASCTSKLGIERNIANVETPLSYEELLSFENYDSEVVDDLREINFQHPAPYTIQLKNNPDLQNDVALKIDLDIELDEYKIILSHVNNKISQSSVSEIINFLNYTLSRNFNSRYSLAELLYNAKKGDLSALSVLAKLRLYNLKATINGDSYVTPAVPELKERLEYWEEKVAAFEKAEKVEAKSRNKIQEQRKVIIDLLDKAAEEKQFKTLVAKNDRKGVANLLRKYLPWEQMPPFEKKYWETQLEIMVDPLPMDKRIMIYRGIQDDLIHASFIDNVDLPKERALKEHKVFLMSTILTKNQGSYNRRLRSLTSMYEKIIATKNGDSSYTRAARISTMFSVHAQDPVGSPFLSFTPRFDIAHTFGKDRKTIFFIDPRALTYNTSGLLGEVELLLPLVTFPDELGAVYDTKEHAEFPNTEDTLHRFAIQNLEQKYGKEKGGVLFKKIQTNSNKYFEPFNETFKSKLNSDFFKKVLGKNSTHVAQQMTPEADIQCSDIIQLFW